VQSFGVISVAHAQIAFGKFTSSRGPIQRDHNPHFLFAGADGVIE